MKMAIVIFVAHLKKKNIKKAANTGRHVNLFLRLKLLALAGKNSIAADYVYCNSDLLTVFPFP